MDFLAELEEKGVQIIEKNVRIEKGSEAWALTGEFLVQEPVGKSAETERIEVGVLFLDVVEGQAGGERRRVLQHDVRVRVHVAVKRGTNY